MDERQRLGTIGRRGIRDQSEDSQCKGFLCDRASPRRAPDSGTSDVGGWSGYEAVYQLYRLRENFPAFNIPLLCVPATIDNNLPGSELSIGADTALNSIVEAVDKIKQSAVASRRCFVVEVMGRTCGYLAQMSGLASGAERVYLPEEEITLSDLQQDIALLTRGFQQGKRLSLMIRNEHAHPRYTTDFISTLFAEEGKGVFDVRQAILGHFQQGGNPTPFDRILAMRLADQSIDFLIAEAQSPRPPQCVLGSKVDRYNSILSTICHVSWIWHSSVHKNSGGLM